MPTPETSKTEKPEARRKNEEDPKNKRPVPVTETTDRGIENADNSDYEDGANIGP